MIINEYLSSNNRMSARIVAGLLLALGGIILTSVFMGLLLLTLSHSELGATVVVAILFLATFPLAYFLAVKLPTIKFGRAFKLFTLLAFVLFVLIKIFISFAVAPPTAPPRHISFAN